MHANIKPLPKGGSWGSLGPNPVQGSTGLSMAMPASARPLQTSRFAVTIVAAKTRFGRGVPRVRSTIGVQAEREVLSQGTAMSTALRITIFDQGRQVYSDAYTEPVELGRQQDKDEGEIYQVRRKGSLVRIPIALAREAGVSRRQVVIEPLPDGWVRLQNPSAEASIRLLEDPRELSPKSSRDLLLPVTLIIGSRKVRLETEGWQAGAGHLESLAESPVPPGRKTPDHSLLKTIAADHEMDWDSLGPWLQAILDVQAAPTSADCYERAAGALADLMTLDAGAVVMFEEARWVVKASKLAPAAEPPARANPPWKPSARILTMVREERRTFWQPPPTRTASTFGVQALVAAPILDGRDEVIGVLYGDRGESGAAGPGAWRSVSEPEAKLVQMLASALAAELAQRKLIQVEHDLTLGRELQEGFLPRELPPTPGWEIAPYFRPALDVSGDFYDAFALPGGRLALALADVCNKGVGAALFMVLFRSLLRAFAERAVETLDSAGNASPAIAESAFITRSAVELTHNYVYQTHGWQCMFCTLFFGVLDTSTGELAYINAGHPPPLVAGTTGVKAALNPTGLPVGMWPKSAYEVERIVLEPDDVLFSYTDGVSESRNPGGELFTEERLLPIMQEPIPSAAALVEKVIARLHEHTAGAEPADDVTMLAIRRTT